MNKSELREMIREVLKEELVSKSKSVTEAVDGTARICGIVFKHDQNDFSVWTDFYLTADEENRIMEILNEHDTEGSSVRGTKEELISEFMI